MPLYQNDDIDIEVSVVDGKSGDLIAPGTVTSAEYRLFNLAKTEVLISKSLGSGIAPLGDLLVVTLDASDTESLRGVFYHEMRVTIGGKSANAISENIRLKPTEIK